MMFIKSTFFVLLPILLMTVAHADDKSQLQEELKQAREEMISAGQENRILKVRLEKHENSISDLREELEKIEQQIEEKSDS